jgi:hypothetical protein
VGVKSQKVSEQVQVKASDRVRIVKQMSAEGTNSAAK